MLAARRPIVAIPARDEADHIAACLQALSGQIARVVLLVNNTTDGTERLAARAALAFGLDLTLSVQNFPDGQCTAGHARKIALDLAAALDPTAILMTTDADSRVAPDWVAANLRHLASGVDAVAGRAVIDPVDAAAIPARLHEDDALECDLGALLDEIVSLLDPDPVDPWPRHREHSGASICVTAEAFHRAGGIPDISSGEDRGFFDALRRVDATIRHAPDVTVTVSGRLVGRAHGGMADTIRRRLSAPDPFLDDALEPVDATVRRATLRARTRKAWSGAGNPLALNSLAADSEISLPELRAIVSAPFFGTAWARLQACCPSLTRERIPAADVLSETARARRLLSSLRVTPARRTNPSGMSQLADAQWA